MASAQEIVEALGGSLAAEEHKGDYAAARRIAEQWVQEAQPAGDAAIAEATLWLAIVRILQGEPNAARALLDDADRRAGDDPSLRYRVASYRWLAIEDHLALSPDGRPVIPLEIQAGGRMPAERLAAVEEQARRGRAAVAAEAIAEADLVQRLVIGPRTYRGFAGQGRRGMSADVIRAMLEMGLSQIAGLGASVPPFAYVVAADLCQRLGDAARAAALIAQADAVYAAMGDAAGQGICRLVQADWAAAPSFHVLSQNLLLDDTTGSRTTVPDTDRDAENALPDDAAIAAVRALLAQAAELFGAAGAPRGQAAVRLREGWLAFLGGDMAAAARACDEARAAFDAAGDVRGAQIAAAHLLSARIANGEVDLDEGARAIGAWGAGDGSISVAVGLGILLARRGHHFLEQDADFERALRAHRTARALFEALGSELLPARSLVDEGDVLAAVEDADAAIACYERAADVFVAAFTRRPDDMVARGRALDHVQGLIKIQIQRADPEGIARAAARLGAVSVPPAAPDPMTMLLLRAAQSSLAVAAATAALYGGRRAHEAGDDARAEALFDQAKASAEAMVDLSRWTLLAAVAAERRAYADAAVAVRGYLDAIEQQAQVAGGDTPIAREARRGALANVLSVAVRVKAFAEGAIALQRLVALAGEDWWKQDGQPWSALSERAALAEGLGDGEAALALYEQAIAAVEASLGRLRRDELKTALGSASGARSLYFRAARAAIDRGDGARAFGYAERGKARALLDLVAGGALLSGAPAGDASQVGAWRRQSAKVEALRGLLARAEGGAKADDIERRLAAEEAALDALEAQLARDRPDLYRALSTRADVLSAAEVAAALPAGALLLEYYFAGDDLLAWAVDRTGVLRALRADVDAARLALRIRAFHAACREGRATDEAGAEVASLLLAPFAAELSGRTRVVVVPHGAAHALPFHALPFEGQPLGDRAVVSYLPSASALRFLRLDAPVAIDRILAVGDPLGDLPGAAREARYLARVHGATALVGPEATKEAVVAKLAQAGVLHLAVHGSLREDAPLLSALRLANGEDLTVYELMGLDLGVDLAVLSACNSGRGVTTGGDDVLGLARGLLGAGARAAIVSLWPVDDDSTTVLMAELYRRLAAGEPPAAALAGAQRRLQQIGAADVEGEVQKVRDFGVPVDDVTAADPSQSDGYRHPFHWAPFMVIG
jgi:CHAT domain-containing protein